MTKALLTLAVAFFAAATYADHHEGGMKDGNHPCKKIHDACEAAGFKKGAWKEGKGLHKDCMMKLAKGETLAGVSVDKGDVDSCKAKMESHKEKHSKAMQEMKETKSEEKKN